MSGGSSTACRCQTGGTYRILTRYFTVREGGECTHRHTVLGTDPDSVK